MAYSQSASETIPASLSGEGAVNTKKMLRPELLVEYNIGSAADLGGMNSGVPGGRIPV